MAFRTADSGEIVFHADRGSQYTSDQIAEYATENGLKCSVGRTGVCWDNAQQESFWAQSESRVLLSPSVGNQSGSNGRCRRLD